MAENSFKLNIIEPDGVFYEGTADMLELNTTEGEIGILPGHIPMTVIIKPGIVTIYEVDGEEKKAVIHAGFVEILQDQVTVLAEIAEWPDEIDEARAEAALGRARERIQSKAADIDMARAEAAMLRALARINVLR
ncbi:MAG: ATP synthase F1 subunit epsilon [Lachnospiraceae bacterium]|nr:ATP synthase F1 subunit epsilon [Lachnospiraceae bacterium]MBQ7777011.1 ATP synthase F1 subunit epsilon [Lachnospiraceae bacterium]